MPNEPAASTRQIVSTRGVTSFDRDEGTGIENDASVALMQRPDDAPVSSDGQRDVPRGECQRVSG